MRAAAWLDLDVPGMGSVARREGVVRTEMLMMAPVWFCQIDGGIFLVTLVFLPELKAAPTMPNACAGESPSVVAVVDMTILLSGCMYDGLGKLMWCWVCVNGI